MGLGDLYELIWTFDEFGELYQTKWHFLGRSAASNAEELAKLPTTYDVWGEMRKPMSNDIVLQTTSATRIRPEPSEEFPFESFTFIPAITGQSMNGARAGSIVDLSLAALVTLRTLEPSRRGRGRWFWGALPEEWILEGKLSLSGWGTIQMWADTILNGTGIGHGGAAPHRWCVWSPNSPEPDGEWTQNVFPITDVVVSRNLAHLHSRRFGAGE